MFYTEEGTACLQLDLALTVYRAVNMCPIIHNLNPKPNNNTQKIPDPIFPPAACSYTGSVLRFL
eukprot:scaffold33314_cov19-Tisochrysis_lutea.AAC.1